MSDEIHYPTGFNHLLIGFIQTAQCHGPHLEWIYRQDLETQHQSKSCHITFEHSAAETTTVGQGKTDFEKSPEASNSPSPHNDSRAASRRNIISGGSTGIIELLPSGYVRKSPYPGPEDRKQSLRDIEREIQIYQRLPQHDRLLQIISYSIEDGIILEYMPNGNLRNYLRSQAVKINREQRLQWACDAAEGLHLLHSYNIIHCDIKPENFLLDSRLRLRIIDFSGSSIDGAWASAFESVRFCLPRPWESPSTVQTDLFALGSTIYEIMTAAQPYEELTDEEVVVLFEEQKFPLVDYLPCGGVIKRCWHGEFDSAEEVHRSIKAEIQK